jgi:NADH-quinone oxidoreductase subunit L
MAGPTPVSALIHAATMVAAGVSLSARMFPIFTPDALTFIAWTGGLTALLTAVVAFTQTDIKKVLAYSTMSQLGYMILGVGVGAPWAGMFHLTTHAMFKACLFLGSGSVIHAMHHAQELKDLGGLRKKMPWTFWTFVVATLALAGIPFLSGFYSKDAILFSALADHEYTLFGLGFFTAFLTALYMTRLTWLCFFGKPRNQEKYDHAKESPWVMTVPLVILAVLSVGVFYRGDFADRHFRSPGHLAAYPETEQVERAYHEKEHHDHPWWFNLLAWTLGAVGIGVGVALYRSGKRDQDSRLLPKPVHDLAKAKYYMDDFYLDGVVGSANRLSDLCRAVDDSGVDGLVNATGRGGVLLSDVSGDADEAVVDGAVNFTADAAQGAGAAVSRVQTGRLRNYLATAMTITAVVIFVILVTYSR